jgi:ABC-type siderophore export system fused ATPase/permease subunit
MKITSEFRILFIIRKILGITFISAVGCFFINSALEKNEWEILLLIIFSELILLFFLVKDFQKIYKIKVAENGIYKISVFLNKTQFIPYNEIKTVRSEKVQGSSTDAGEITLGYFESVLITDKNQKILISPDHFENYNEIMKTIKLNRNEENY